MTDFKTVGIATFAALGAVMLAPSQGSAVTFAHEQVVDGNDCAGVLGTPPNCALNGSDLIAKINPDGSVSEFGLFPSIDGSEFTLTFSGDGKTGTWTYAPGVGDPGITGWTAKGGPRFTVYLGSGVPGFDGLSGSWDIQSGLSHITFFDSASTVVPLPAAAWLLLSGVAGLAMAGRRRNAAA
ncbi:MAG: hypothetical protein CO163_03875 [Rhodobacterales bacterium CG_4_9_14_3_um_filter_71_31]|nr:MAG: hypothetical protein CO163_03875 [Rhodobacterales bacterium CG_4_9_14_3_um_filter_71_31]